VHLFMVVDLTPIGVDIPKFLVDAATPLYVIQMQRVKTTRLL